MAASDITAMKETLRAQQQLLQKLYSELDEEREASATAASEALDMILRLQGEKAAVKMEARQYERMTEEKLEHAETTLEIFEELMFQKDMEIASLEHQVQGYKRKLVSLGCDPNLTESELQESNNDDDNQLFHRTDEHHLNPENEPVRRLNSLPPLPVNKNNFRTTRKRERSPSPLIYHTDMIQTIEEKKTEIRPVQHSSDFGKNSVDSTHETFDAYWEQIRKLDEKVKEISDCKEIEGHKPSNLRGRRHRSCSLFRGRSETFSSISSHQVLHEVKQQNREAIITDPSCSVNVHDVFEVPQAGDSNNRVNNKHGKNRLERLGTIDSDSRLTKPDPEVPVEKAEELSRYDSGKLMRVLSINMETKEHSPNDGHNNKITCMFGPKMEGTTMECNGEAEFRLLSKRIERLEKERDGVSSSQEITHEGDGEEQLRLLKEILSQLRSMREEVISSKAKKSPPKHDDGLLDRLKEALLYCWI